MTTIPPPPPNSIDIFFPHKVYTSAVRSTSLIFSKSNIFKEFGPRVLIWKLFHHFNQVDLVGLLGFLYDYHVNWLVSQHKPTDCEIQKGDSWVSQTIHEMVESKARTAKAAMRQLSKTSSDVRNRALLTMAESIIRFKDKIREANEADLKAGHDTGLAAPLMSRLALDDKKIERMVDNLRQVAALPDPIGEIVHMGERPNGLKIGTVRVPIGVIGVIYESRPDVTVEVSALCVKSGNGVILRGGSEAIHSNTALANILTDTAEREGAPGAIQFVDITDRQAVREMISMSDCIDLVVPPRQPRVYPPHHEDLRYPCRRSCGRNLPCVRR